MISHLELRKEESPDIAVFTHKRNMETVIVSLGSDLSSVRERFMLVCSCSPVFCMCITGKVVLYVPQIPLVCDLMLRVVVNWKFVGNVNGKRVFCFTQLVSCCSMITYLRLPFLVICPVLAFSTLHISDYLRFYWQIKLSPGLAYFMEQGPSWKTSWFSASPELPHVLWNLKVHYHI